MEELPLQDEINIQSDKRKAEKLVDENIISPDDIANAPVYLVEPVCKCDKGLEYINKALRCPQCLEKGKDTPQETP